jgi:hypothetical protein
MSVRSEGITPKGECISIYERDYETVKKELAMWGTGIGSSDRKLLPKYIHRANFY